MKTRVQKWGNSLAVRIPKHIVSEVGLEYNATVEMEIEDDKLIIQRIKKVPTLEQLLARVNKNNLHTTVDTGNATGNEVW